MLSILTNDKNLKHKKNMANISNNVFLTVTEKLMFISYRKKKLRDFQKLHFLETYLA